MNLFATNQQIKTIPTQKLADMENELKKYTDELRKQIQKKQKERDLQQEDNKKSEDNKKIKKIKKLLL